MYIFNRTSNQLNDFIKLTWLSDHVKWVNDRTEELEHVKMNQQLIFFLIRPEN
jgi:hypothetical protein